MAITSGSSGHTPIGHSKISGCTYDPATGRTTDIDAENVGFQTLQSLSLEFDVLGNLTQKRDQSGLEGGGFKDITESYTYDGLNRLTQVQQGGNTTLALAYDALGNITSKLAYTTAGGTDTNANVGSYSYGSRPHAVTAAGSATYTYDANGSMLSGDGRSVLHAVMGKPTSIVRGSDTVSVYYGPNRNRYKRIDNVGQSSESETHYIGSVERTFKPGGVEVIKRYLDGEAIVTRTDQSGTVSYETHYLLTDHLGSTCAWRIGSQAATGV
ncbi:MAG: hypothetical protein R3E82_03850 [Pseudomonadales bacterium]